MRDIIISDIRNARHGRIELMRRVRSGGATIPAVAATAFAGSEDRMRALQAGFNMYLVKPVEPQELVKIVAALVSVGSSG